MHFTSALLSLAACAAVVSAAPAMDKRQSSGGPCDCLFDGGCSIEQNTPGEVHCRAIEFNSLSYTCPITGGTFNCNACFQSGHVSEADGLDDQCHGTKLCESFVSGGEFDVPIYTPCGNI